MTKQATHTPGPWCINPSYDNIISTVEDDADIAEISGWPPSLEAEETANKNLIAAAPELLEAGRRALNYIENKESELGIKLGSGDALRAAIAKARGETGHD